MKKRRQIAIINGFIPAPSGRKAAGFFPQRVQPLTDGKGKKTDESRRKTHEFLRKTDEFPRKTDEFPRKTHEFPGKTVEFLRKTHEFPGKTVEFLRKTDEFPGKTDVAERLGLAGYWRFDEGSGGTAFDSSPKGHDGTLYSLYRSENFFFRKILKKHKTDIHMATIFLFLRLYFVRSVIRIIPIH